MIKWIEQNKQKSIMIGILVIMVIPSIIYALSSIPLLPVGGNNDWAGFWGGYIGAIIGGLITLFVMNQTLKDGENGRKREEQIKFFDKIIDVSSEYCQSNADMCRRMSFFFNEPSLENYNFSVEAMNYAAKIKIKLEILIETRKGTYDLEQILNEFKEVEACSEKISNMYDDMFKDIFINKISVDTNQYREKEEELLKKLNEMGEVIKTTILSNLY